MIRELCTSMRDAAFAVFGRKEPTTIVLGGDNMTNEEAAKKLVYMYGTLMVTKDDVNGTYAEAVAMGAAALLYSKEVKPNANTNWNSGSNVR